MNPRWRRTDRPVRCRSPRDSTGWCIATVLACAALTVANGAEEISTATFVHHLVEFTPACGFDSEATQKSSTTSNTIAANQSPNDCSDHASIQGKIELLNFPASMKGTRNGFPGSGAPAFVLKTPASINPAIKVSGKFTSSASSSARAPGVIATFSCPEGGNSERRDDGTDLAPGSSAQLSASANCGSFTRVPRGVLDNEEVAFLTTYGLLWVGDRYLSYKITTIYKVTIGQPSPTPTPSPSAHPITLSGLDQKIAARAAGIRLNIHGTGFTAGASPEFLKGDG